MSEKSDNLISLTEAAGILGLTRKRVYDYIKDGRLPAQKIGTTYAIREKDLEKVKNLKPGRPLSETPSTAALKKRESRAKKEK